MGCGGKPKTHKLEDQASPLADQQASISRSMFDDYMTRFFPQEVDVMEELKSDDYSYEQAAKAADSTKTAYESASGVTDRALSGHGVKLSADQQQARDRLHKTNAVAGVASAQNNTRRGVEARKLQVGDAMVNRGRYQLQQSQNQLAQAAQLETGRNRQDVAALNDWEKAKAKRKSNILGTVAAVALTVATGGAAAPLLAAQVANSAGN